MAAPDRTPAPAPSTAPSTAPARPPARRPPSVVGIVVVATAAFVALVITVGIFLPAIGAIGDLATRDPATLPDRLTVCGVEWTKDPLSRAFTRAEVFERTEADPIVVEVALTTACPAAVGSGDAMATEIEVQVDADAFVPYTRPEAP